MRACSARSRAGVARSTAGGGASSDSSQSTDRTRACAPAATYAVLAERSCVAAPRGQKIRPTSRPMVQPMAMSTTARLTRLPARGLEQAEEHHDEHGERCLTDDEAHRGRRVRGQEGDHREGDPQQRAVFTDRHEHASGHEADERAGHGLQHREAGPEGVRAQRGQRAEPDPERVGRSPATATPMAAPRPRPMRRALRNSTESRPQVRTDGRDHPRRHRGARRRREHRRAACAVVVLAAQRERGVDHRQTAT